MLISEISAIDPLENCSSSEKHRHSTSICQQMIFTMAAVLAVGTAEEPPRRGHKEAKHIIDFHPGVGPGGKSCSISVATAPSSPSSLVLAIFTGSSAEAKSRALLIGASEYTSNDQIKDLAGPRNDVTAMWRYLKSAGYGDDDITVLSDGLPQTAAFPKLAGRAEYRNIIDELDRLASYDYGPNDVVVFFFAGHGTTLPDDDPSAEVEPEANGRDQVLLPTDTGFRIEGGTYPNVLIDDELGRKLDAIRARGVNVWAILDACNSGGGTRGGEEARYVDPEALGFAGELPPLAETRGMERVGPIAPHEDDRAGMGRLIGFYAVDLFNLAYERHFEFADYQKPVAGTDSRTQRMGTFSNYLNRALMTGSAQTYEQLFQEIVAGIAADPDSTSKPRPVADGELSLAVPGRENGAPRLKALLEKGTLRIPAGTFQGFERLAGVTVYDPMSPQTAIATGKISSATAANSMVAKLSWLDPARAQETAAMPLPVKVTDPVTRFSFSVGSPDNLASLSPVEQSRIEAVLRSAFEENDDFPELGVTTKPADAPDLNLLTHVEDGRLWLLFPNRNLVKSQDSFEQTLSIDLGGSETAVADALRNAVWQLSRAERLVRTAAVHPTGVASDLAIEAGLYREGERAADPRISCADRSTKPLSDTEKAHLRAVSAADGPSAVGNCDVVRVAIANRSTANDYLVGGFYVDARGGILALPLSSGDESMGNCVFSLPKRQDQQLSFELQVTTWSDDGSGNPGPAPTGLERMIVIAMKRDGSGLTPNLCALGQESLSATIATRDIAMASVGTAAELDRLIGDIVGSGTRGFGTALKAGTAPKVAMETYMLELSVAP